MTHTDVKTKEQTARTLRFEALVKAGFADIYLSRMTKKIEALEAEKLGAKDVWTTTDAARTRTYNAWIQEMTAEEEGKCP